MKKEIFVEGFKVFEQKNVIYDDFDIGSYFIKKSDYERLVPFKVSSDNCSSAALEQSGVSQCSCACRVRSMNQALLKIDRRIHNVNSFFLGLWRSQSFEQQVLGMTHEDWDPKQG